jgi:FkbM family methyltransferase
VVELGGGLGVTACIANRRLAHPSNHIVVEPNATLIAVLEKNRQWNRCSFEIVHGAMDYSGAAVVHLNVHRDFISAIVGVDDGHRSPVPAVTLATLLARHRFTHGTLICDIEGVEVPLVEREVEVLREAFTTLFIEIHPWTRQDYAAMFARLRSRGFLPIATVGKVHAFRQNS